MIIKVTNGERYCVCIVVACVVGIMLFALSGNTYFQQILFLS